ncbi:MAG: hypothetical protein BA066_00135 [Candidatus Korarchaeota archaeon NZ13-K]|nr:MAG: hypothetical protein BA066_00135 [Candidatus Korarchaeota archaeon NZ13-K]
MRGNDRKDLWGLVRTLKEIGLSEYEAKILARLSLSREPLRVADLSSLTGVPRTKVYPVISSLERGGLVRVHGGRPIKISAPPPSELASLLAERILSETSTKLSLLDVLFRLNLTEGLWVVERSTIPVRGERTISRISSTIIMGAREKINIILSERNIYLLPKRLPNIVSAVVESPSTHSALGIPRARCRIVGKHSVFMVLSESACIFSDEGLNSGIFTSEESLLSAFSDLFKGLYASGVIPPR